MLEELCFISPDLKPYPDTLNLPPQSLPRLRYNDGVAEYVIPLVRGRPIRSVTLSGRSIPSSYSSLRTSMPNLGSLTTIRSLALNYSFDPLEALAFAVSGFPALYELIIMAPFKYFTTPVGHSPAAPIHTDSSQSCANLYIIVWIPFKNSPGNDMYAKYWSRLRLISRV